MAIGAFERTSALCWERRKLTEELLEAMRAITHLQEAQTGDVISGGSGLPRIDLALTAARRSWKTARNAYFGHVKKHGC